MDFRILGPLEAFDEGRVVMLGGGKQRALLAVFLLHRGETLSTDRLIDELWGERPPATAAKTVQVYISRLRKALAGGEDDGSAGVVATREHGYELELDPQRLDAHRFERLVARGRGDLAAGRYERAAAALEGALSLWRGPPLADLAYEPFAQREIARLDDLRVAALEQLIEAKLALGAHAEVVEQLETLIAEHPYRERLRAQLMLGLYRSDRQADALQAYQDARRTLVEELGIEPGERLRELERAILAQDPGLALAAAEGPAAAEPAAETARTAFVGRERELAELVGGLDDAFAGRGRLFLLVGEPGIGKSRLAEELTVRARARGARILVGRCWEAGGAPAYWPWVQSLRPYLRDTDADSLRSQLREGAADVARLLPELRDRLADLPPAPPLESEGARFRLFDSMTAFLKSVAAGRPLVLVLDDLYAADEPSLLLLQFVARELGDSRLLIVGAYRDVDPTLADPLTTTLTELAREPVTRTLALAGLGEADVARFIELTAPGASAADLGPAVKAETEGNPLFVGEIVRLLAAEGRLDEPAIEPLAIPQSVREVIGRRLRHLSDECNRLLAMASVLGREFDLNVLAGVSGLERGAILELLDEGIEARVVSEVPGVIGRMRFREVPPNGDMTTVQTGAAGTYDVVSVAGDATGNLYAATKDPDYLIQVNLASGQTTTVVGTGTSGYNGNSDPNTGLLPGTKVQVNGPQSLSVALNGDVVFADTGNHLIRAYVPSSGYVADPLAGLVSGGTPQKGFNGDGHWADETELDLPAGVTVTRGALLVVADTGNSRVRQIGPSPLPPELGRPGPLLPGPGPLLPGGARPQPPVDGRPGQQPVNPVGPPVGPDGAPPRPNNRFALRQLKVHRDGAITFAVRVRGPGTIRALVTARRARQRFVFGRTYKRARRATTLRLRVSPNARGRRLVRHDASRLRLRLSVSYTPTGGQSRRVGFPRLRVPGSS
jgi:DNA-binding SARP family transcriptional activator